MNEHLSHPSYGQVTISRCTSNVGHVLYGSLLRHDAFLSFRLHRSEIYRENGIERHFPREIMAEFLMSEAQFAQMITTLNIGSGVPVTISHFDNKRIDAPPARNERVEVDKDLKKASQDAVTSAEKVLTEMGQMISSGKINKTTLKRLQNELENAIRQMASSASFLKGVFDESIEKAVTAAKADFDNYVRLQLQQAGLQQLGVPVTSEKLMLAGEKACPYCGYYKCPETCPGN